MRKVGRIFSATLVVSTLVVGSSAAYITTSPDAQAAEQVQKWGHGEGGSNGGESVSAQGSMNLEAETPWYNYEGYTTYDPSFTQDYNFVRALKYDNVSIDGYKVETDAKGGVDHTKDIYNTTVEFNEDDQVVGLTFLTKPDSVSKSTFKDAHESNKIIDEGENVGDDEDTEGTFVEYETNNGSYTAYFDEDDKLMQMRIG